jgi:hypothetical protein
MRLIAVAMACALLPACAAPVQAERVLKFHTDLAVQDDGALLVSEHITILSTGDRFKHGITRQFAKDAAGGAGFELIEVLRDAQPVVHSLVNVPGGTRLYAGEKSMPLAAGEHAYKIRFRTPPLVWSSAERRGLDWSVTGRGWGVPIDGASATVDLPAGVARRSVQAGGRAGPPGLGARYCEARVDRQGNVTLRSLKRLGIGEGLTIRVSWARPSGGNQ